MAQHPDLIPEKRPGDPILAKEWNWLISALRASGALPGGFSSSAGSSSKQVIGSYPRKIIGRSDVAVPAYSIFVLGDDSNTSQPLSVGIEQYDAGPGSSPALLLFTNGASSIPEGGQGEITPVVAYAPTRVSITGTPPIVGAQCGPELGGWGVDANSGGLLCVALEGENFAWVYALLNPGIRLFRLEESISPGGSANGNLQKWNGTGWEDSDQIHEIFDSLGVFSKDASAYCWAVYAFDSSRYEMIQLPC